MLQDSWRVVSTRGDDDLSPASHESHRPLPQARSVDGATLVPASTARRPGKAQHAASVRHVRITTTPSDARDTNGSVCGSDNFQNVRQRSDGQVRALHCRVFRIVQPPQVRMGRRAAVSIVVGKL